MAMIKIIDSKKIPIERRYTFKDDYKDIEAECYVDLSQVSISVPFEKNGMIWSPCLISHKEEYAVCQKIEFNKEVDHEFVSEITCPFCGNSLMDSWEMPDTSENEICGYCGSEFSYERIVTVEYCTSKIKKYEPEKIT